MDKHLPPHDHRPPHNHRPPHGVPPYGTYDMYAPHKHPHGKPDNHHAHFTPHLLHYHIPNSFKFWCNKVVPLVYDDSLSYMELLNKVVMYLNGMLEDEKLVAVNMEEIVRAYHELENFVNDYFSFYQSKGIINHDIAVTNSNYLEILPDCDTAQMNTAYRLKFVEGSEQNIPANLPTGALPFSGAECVLLNLSNFILKRLGGEWQEVPPNGKQANVTNNYQLLITDRDIYFRENNGDSWQEWQSIFGNWWSVEWNKVKEYIDNGDQTVMDAIKDAVNGVRTALENEINRATERENEIAENLQFEVERAQDKEQELDDKISQETERAQGKERELDDKISQEIVDRTNADRDLSTAITAETTRATTAENDLSSRITSEVSRATTAENSLSERITNEVSRATTAENTLSERITNETSRATTAENALSARIQDWETDLAQEREDRQQGDLDLARQITAFDERISQNATEINNVKNGYIPNAGNNTEDDLNITRHTVNINTSFGAIDIDADGGGEIVVNDSVIFKGGGGGQVTAGEEITAEGYDGGKVNISDAVEISANDGGRAIVSDAIMLISSDNGRVNVGDEITMETADKGKIVISDVVDITTDGGDIDLITSRGDVQIRGAGVRLYDPTSSVLLYSTGIELDSKANVTIVTPTANGKAYYQKGNYHDPIANEEIATIGTVESAKTELQTNIDGNHDILSRAIEQLDDIMTTYVDNETDRAESAEQAIRDGYIPNVGNVTNDNFELTRPLMSLMGNGNYTHGITAMQGNVVAGAENGSAYINAFGGKGYYRKNRTPATDNDEIATVGNVSAEATRATNAENALGDRITELEGEMFDPTELENYIPNVGNTKDGNFYINRTGSINLHSGGVNFGLQGDGTASIYSTTCNGFFNTTFRARADENSLLNSTAFGNNESFSQLPTIAFDVEGLVSSDINIEDGDSIVLPNRCRLVNSGITMSKISGSSDTYGIVSSGLYGKLEFDGLELDFGSDGYVFDFGDTSTVKITNCFIKCSTLFKVAFSGNVYIDGCVIVGDINLNSTRNFTISNSTVDGYISVGELPASSRKLIVSNTECTGITGSGSNDVKVIGGGSDIVNYGAAEYFNLNTSTPTYTAPADGWFYMRITNVSMKLSTDFSVHGERIIFADFSNSSGNIVTRMYPIKKGNTITYETSSGSGSWVFAFIPKA